MDTTDWLIIMTAAGPLTSAQDLLTAPRGQQSLTLSPRQPLSFSPRSTETRFSEDTGAPGTQSGELRSGAAQRQRRGWRWARIWI